MPKSLAAKAAAKSRYKAWANANREHVRAYNRAKYAKNLEKSRAYARAWYAANPWHREKRAEYLRERKRLARLEAFAHYGHDSKAACCRCGIDDIDVLTLDHLDNSGARHRKTEKQARTIAFWVIKNGLPPGFQTLCFNCNYKKYIEGLRAKRHKTA